MENLERREFLKQAFIGSLALGVLAVTKEAESRVNDVMSIRNEDRNDILREIDDEILKNLDLLKQTKDRETRRKILEEIDKLYEIRNNLAYRGGNNRYDSGNEYYKESVELNFNDYCNLDERRFSEFIGNCRKEGKSYHDIIRILKDNEINFNYHKSLGFNHGFKLNNEITTLNGVYYKKGHKRFSGVIEENKEETLVLDFGGKTERISLFLDGDILNIVNLKTKEEFRFKIRDYRDTNPYIIFQNDKYNIVGLKINISK